jgi:hypothetical protein
MFWINDLPENKSFLVSPFFILFKWVHPLAYLKTYTVKRLYPSYVKTKISLP